MESAACGLLAARSLYARLEGKELPAPPVDTTVSYTHLLVERAVQVVGLAPVIAGGGKHLVVVQTFSGDDGGHGIVEVQPLVTGQGPDLIGQCAIGQGAGDVYKRQAAIWL